MSNLHEKAKLISHNLGYEIDSTLDTNERRGSAVFSVRSSGAHAALKVANVERLDANLVGDPLEFERQVSESIGLGPWPRHLSSGVVAESETSYLLTEWLDHPTVPDYFKENLPSENRLDVTILAFQALGELHNRGVLHGDIQPAHLLYDQKEHRVCLIDFGAGAFFDDADRSPYLGGMTHFVAPELAAIILERGLGRRTIAADIYAMAASITWCVARDTRPMYEQPKGQRELNEMLQTITKGAFKDHSAMLEDALGAEAAQVISLCLADNPNFRPESAADVVSLLLDFRQKY